MMKKICTLFLFCFCLTCVSLHADTADNLKKQAETALANQELDRARALFAQAYNTYLAANKLPESIECGVQVANLYHTGSMFAEAFEFLRGLDQLVAQKEQADGKPLPQLHYPVTKERLRMYIRLKRPESAQTQLNILESYAKAAANAKLDDDLLYTQANYYYTFGKTALGDAAFKKMTERYKEKQDLDKIDEVYQTIIGMGKSSNNAALVDRTYKQYYAWKDSVKAINAKDEYSALKVKYDDSLQTIAAKDSSLATRQYFIIGLCTLAAILAGALILGAVILLRFVMLSRKQKKAIQLANLQNAAKTKFIGNISAQMEPTLNTLNQNEAGVKALLGFSRHIQQMSELENTREQKFELEETNVAPYCESLMDQIRDKVKPDVTLTVNAPKLQVKINKEELAKILVHLLENAAEYTPAGGKIWLDFKKRGAHTHQFQVTDTGCGIPEERREKIFQPFSEIKDLTQGDGLGLPICSLLAEKMNGTLYLDTQYVHGARFVIELHT